MCRGGAFGIILGPLELWGNPSYSHGFPLYLPLPSPFPSLTPPPLPNADKPCLLFMYVTMGWGRGTLLWAPKTGVMEHFWVSNLEHPGSTHVGSAFPLAGHRQTPLCPDHTDLRWLPSPSSYLHPSSPFGYARLCSNPSQPLGCLYLHHDTHYPASRPETACPELSLHLVLPLPPGGYSL